MRASTARPYNQTLNSLDFSLEKFGDVLFYFREHTDAVGCVGRQLPEVVSAVGVALDDSRTRGSCRDVPAHIADLRCDGSRLEHHLDLFLNIRNGVALELYVGIGVFCVDYTL